MKSSMLNTWYKMKPFVEFQFNLRIEPCTNLLLERHFRRWHVRISKRSLFWCGITKVVENCLDTNLQGTREGRHIDWRWTNKGRNEDYFKWCIVLVTPFLYDSSIHRKMNMYRYEERENKKNVREEKRERNYQEGVHRRHEYLIELSRVAQTCFLPSFYFSRSPLIPFPDIRGCPSFGHFSL